MCLKRQVCTQTFALSIIFYFFGLVHLYVFAFCGFTRTTHLRWYGVSQPDFLWTYIALLISCRVDIYTRLCQRAFGLHQWSQSLNGTPGQDLYLGPQCDCDSLQLAYSVRHTFSITWILPQNNFYPLILFLPNVNNYTYFNCTYVLWLTGRVRPISPSAFAPLFTCVLVCVRGIFVLKVLCYEYIP